MKSHKTRTMHLYLYFFYRACFCLQPSADFTLFLFSLGRHCYFAVCAIWKDAHNILQQQIKGRSLHAVQHWPFLEKLSTDPHFISRKYSGTARSRSSACFFHGIILSLLINPKSEQKIFI